MSPSFVRTQLLALWRVFAKVGSEEAKVIADYHSRVTLHVQDLKWAQEYRLREQQEREDKSNMERKKEVGEQLA